MSCIQLSSEEQMPSQNARKAMKLLNPPAKKGLLPDKSEFTKKTRQGQELAADDTKTKTFSKNNFTAAKTDHQVRFQLQELAKFIMTHLEKINFTIREKAALVSFLVKQFQKSE